jgi:hypothetical protein
MDVVDDICFVGFRHIYATCSIGIGYSQNPPNFAVDFHWDIGICHLSIGEKSHFFATIPLGKMDPCSYCPVD